MKHVSQPLFLFTIACMAALCMGVRPAQARDSYGYIYGLSGSTGNVSSITVYDNTTHVFEGNSRGLAWAGPYGVPQGLRWFANGLSPGHSYTVTIYPNGFPRRQLSVTETIPWGLDDYKWPNITFYGLY